MINSFKLSRRAWLRLSLMILLMSCSTAQLAGAADWRADGPKSLIMTYRTAPADRVKLRQIVQRQVLSRFDAMQAQGKIARYQVFFSRYVDNDSWDMAVILNFASTEALAAWKSSEAKTPGGLPDVALRLITSMNSQPADLNFNRAADPRPGDPALVYLVVPYDYHVSTDDYLRYVEGYVLPQANAWIDEGALTSYDFYVGRYAAGRTWASLLVLGYKGDVGLAARDRTTAKVRARLVADPAWKAYSDTKQSIRTEKQPVVADILWP